MSRILIVDDDPAVLKGIQTLLERSGHETVAVAGRDGIAALEATACDAVICDIFMPGMEGFETIRTFRRIAPQTSVIAMSGYAFGDEAPDFLAMATQLGAACSLRKPFRPEELLTAVRACTAVRTAEPGLAATGLHPDVHVPSGEAGPAGDGAP